MGLGLLALSGCGDSDGSAGSEPWPDPDESQPSPAEPIPERTLQGWPDADPLWLDLGFRNSAFTPDAYPPRSASEVLEGISGAPEDSGLAPMECASWWLAGSLVTPDDEGSDDVVGSIGSLRADDQVGLGGTWVGMTYREFDDPGAADAFLMFVAASASRCPNGYTYTQTSWAWENEVSDEVGTDALAVTRGKGPEGGSWVLVDEQGVEGFGGDYTTYDDHHWHYFFAYRDVVIEFLNIENDWDSSGLEPQDRDVLFAEAVRQLDGLPRSWRPEDPAPNPSPTGDRLLVLEDLIGLRIGGDFEPGRGPSETLYWEPSFYRAPWDLETEDPLAQEFRCRNLLLATLLMRPEDTGLDLEKMWEESGEDFGEERDRIVVLDDARLWYPHVVRTLSARQFSSSSEAEAFIRLVRDSIEPCRSGYEIPLVGNYPSELPSADVEVLVHPDVGEVTILRQPTREWRDSHEEQVFSGGPSEETYYFAQVENLVVLYSVTSLNWAEPDDTARQVFSAVAARLDRDPRTTADEVEPDFYVPEGVEPYDGHFWLYELADGFRPWLRGHFLAENGEESTAAAAISELHVPTACSAVWTASELVTPADSENDDPLAEIGDLIVYDEDAQDWELKRTLRVRAREFDDPESAGAFLEEIATDGLACSNGASLEDGTSIGRVTVVSQLGGGGRESVSLIRERVIRVNPESGYRERLREWNTHVIAYANIVVAFDYVDDYNAATLNSAAVSGLFDQVVAHLHWAHHPYWYPGSP